MSRKKAGLCKCTHEIRYWHNAETGACAFASGFNGAGEPHPPASLFGGCPCVRKVKGKKTMTKRETTQPVTVRREEIMGALDKLHEAFCAMQRAGELVTAAGGESAKAIHMLRVELLGAPALPAILRDAEPGEIPIAPTRPVILPFTKRRDPMAPAFVPGAETIAPLSRMRRAFLTVLAQYPEGLARSSILLHADYRSSGDTSVEFAALVRDGLAREDPPLLIISLNGLAALGPYTKLPTGGALLAKLVEGSAGSLSKLERALLATIATYAGTRPLRRLELLAHADYGSSGDTSKAFAKLKRLGYAVDRDHGLMLAPVLYG